MTAQRYVCVHGHFYQPPRENPWLEAVEVQDSARPYHDWNARVTAECYAPNAVSRLLDAERRIVGIANNYAQISFNVGPTLLAWLEEAAPEVYLRILEADRDSRGRRGGHGNALAQAYNHMILPLATRRDKETQVAWGIADFRRRFGRPPEGMWLPETAVDTETLEVLAARGITFTILAPHQAARVRSLRGEEWRDVREAKIDPRRPYLCLLPSGAVITLFFYDGPIARGVAFEGLLHSGEAFAGRLAGGFREDPETQLVHIATDGESYGHHHPFGEMALTAALRLLEARGQARLTNYAEYLAAHPPDDQVEIAERTSWSCAHGVERWRADCGCRAGHPGWNQQWRGPLREALDWLRDECAGVFEREGGRYLRDPWAAREAYIDVILRRAPEVVDEFFAHHAAGDLGAEDRSQAFRLLEMQRHALLMYTSCGWFFDELSGIETVQVIKYAARAVQLAEGFGRPLEEEFLRRIAAARSNLSRWADGANIYRRAVRPAMVTLPRVVAHYGLSALFEPYAEEERVFSFTVRREDAVAAVRGDDASPRGAAGHGAGASPAAPGPAPAAGYALIAGRVTAASRISLEHAEAAFAALHLGGQDLRCGVRVDPPRDWYAETAAALEDAFRRPDAGEAARVLGERFGTVHTLTDLFLEERRKILDLLIQESLAQADGVYRKLYEESRPVILFMRDSDVPVPPAFLVAAEYTLTRDLAAELRRAAVEAVSDRTFELARLIEALGVVIPASETEPLLRRALEAHAKGLTADPFGLPLDQTHRLLDLAEALGITTNLWQVQNAYHAAAGVHRDELLAKTSEAARVEEFWRLGARLTFNLDRLRAQDRPPE